MQDGDDIYDPLIEKLNNALNNRTTINAAEIKSVFRMERCAKGNFFVREDDIPSKMGFIVEGLMKYYYIDSDGNEWIKHFSSENEFVASYASFLYKTPSPYYIEAMEDTVMLCIGQKPFTDNINTSLLWSSIARQYTEKIYWEKEKREASFLKQSASERYKGFLHEYAHLAERITLKDIASFLGMTPVSLSRIRNKKQGRLNKC